MAMIADRPAAFSSVLVLSGALYLWLIGWFVRYYLLFVAWLIGAQRYHDIEQAMVIRVPQSSTSGIIIFGFHSILMFIWSILIVIPLYLIWAFWYRRRDAYLASIGGGTRNV